MEERRLLRLLRVGLGTFCPRRMCRFDLRMTRGSRRRSKSRGCGCEEKGGQEQFHAARCCSRSLPAQALAVEQLLHAEVVDRHTTKLEIVAFLDFESALGEEARCGFARVDK